MSTRTLTLQERNLALLDAVNEIFPPTLSKSSMTHANCVEMVKRMYEVVRWVWPAGLDLASTLPKPDGSLRALYLGDPRPEHVSQNILRFSLYADQILVINPFFCTELMNAEYSPAVHPEDYTVDTFKLASLVRSLEPWIRSGIVTLVPDPAGQSRQFMLEALALAKARIANNGPTAAEKDEMQRNSSMDLARLAATVPAKLRPKLIQDLFPGLKPAGYSELSILIGEIESNDPMVPVPSSKVGQTMIVRAGGNLETAMFLAQATGAFPYTNYAYRWRELKDAALKLPEDSKTWTPLTQAFHGLDFKFLNNVDLKFADSLRKDGRLNSFRSFLRKLWGVSVKNPNVSEGDIRDYKDELRSEYAKAKAEWDGIDRGLVLGTGGATAVAVATGSLHPFIAAAGFAVTGVYQLVNSHLHRKEFQKKVPMSVLIDLERSNKP